MLIKAQVFWFKYVIIIQIENKALKYRILACCKSFANQIATF
jgi:hypothetical protein